MRRRRTVLSVAMVILGCSGVAGESCPERPACSGCGCKGGTGYRGPDGTCVGFRQLDMTCGPLPHAACAFENAPNTGLNRDCALAPKRRTRDSPGKNT